MNIFEKLLEIQHELKAPKNQINKFGGYNYRSCEDILEAVKPLTYKNKCTLVVGDEVTQVGERIYIKATATLFDTESDMFITNTALARESEVKKGMDDSQISGTASSYARKYALNGLFNIDDTKDADTDELGKKKKKAENKEIDKSVKEEFQVDESEMKISAGKIKALKSSITNNNISELTVQAILGTYDYNSIEDIKVKDYMQIVGDLKTNIGGNK